MRSFVDKINQLGLSGISDPLDFRRVLFVNSLSLLSTFISFGVTILLIFEGLYPQFFVTFTATILFWMVVFLNHKRLYAVARSCFLALSISILVVASYVAYNQQRFNDVENILIAYMAVGYLLYDSKWRYISFISIFFVLIGLKIMKQQYMGLPLDFNFYLGIQNTAILCLVIFLFANAFRKSLLTSYIRLKEKDELLYSMIDSVPLFIGLIDKDMRYRMVNINYEKSFGLDRDKIIGSHMDDVLPDNILETHTPLVEKALEGESPEFLEHTQMPDGSSFYAGGKYMPVYASSGEITGVSVFVNDVTKLELAKHKLQDANSTKDKLFSIVAHDIRGPLDLFEGLLDVSKDIEMNPKDFLNHQSKIKEKLFDLKDTVNTLLEWARTQLDGVNAFPTSVDIKEIIESNLDLYKELVNQKKIDLHIDLSSKLTAWIDRNHLKIGIRNILHNALKFTPKEGEISIEGYADGSDSVLVIKDSGIGMNEDQIHSILSKEVQVSSSGTAGELGTGLGLSLSLELLEKNRCKVEIQSQKGRGTTIKIRIPRHK